MKTLATVLFMPVQMAVIIVVGAWLILVDWWPFVLFFAFMVYLSRHIP